MDKISTKSCDTMDVDDTTKIDVDSLENEMKLLKNILDNKRLIRLVKASVNNMIKILICELKFDPNSFFSNNIHKFGNIGQSNQSGKMKIDCKDMCTSTNTNPDKFFTEDKVNKKLEYLMSFDSTVREKVTAISNTIINDYGSDNSLKKINAGNMCDYIRKNDKNTNNDWIVKRADLIDQITKIKTATIKTTTSKITTSKIITIKTTTIKTTTDKITTNNYSDVMYLWAPIYLLYDAYREKHDRTKKLLNNVKNFDHKTYGICQSDLNEPLSNLELDFIKTTTDLGTYLDTYLDTNIESKLLWMPGKFVYKDSVSALPEFKTRDKSLIVGGVSGHTILMMELALLLNVNWIPIFFACIITQVPHHHSITEIIDALLDMKLVDMNLVDKSKVSQTDTIHKRSIVLDLGKNLGIDLECTCSNT
jgi:hypothetical protein